jgi:hypothetical protein
MRLTARVLPRPHPAPSLVPGAAVSRRDTDTRAALASSTVAGDGGDGSSSTAAPPPGPQP